MKHISTVMARPPSLLLVRDGPERGTRPPAGDGEMRTLSLVESAAHRIADMIGSGELKAGDRLPSERSLAATLGISRSALREAISTLDSVGLVEARVGSGRYVRRIGTEEAFAPLRVWMSLQPIGEVIALRRVLEPHAIRAMPAVKVASTLAECEALLVAIRRAVDDKAFESAAGAHTRFHHALAQHARMRLERMLLRSLTEAAEDTALAIFRTPVAAQRSLHAHDEILAPLREGDVETTALRVAEHLEPAFRY